MRTTAAALRELQDYVDSLSPKPNVREIARIAGMPYSTAARYLNGTTRQGLPDNVRALAKALGREDIANEVVTDAPTKNTEALWLVELQREMREEIKETEMRFEQMLQSKDESIRRLSDRIEKLESDKATLSAEKADLSADFKRVRNKKRFYEGIIVCLFLLFALYFIIFDLPYPDSGVTEILINLFSKK